MNETLKRGISGAVYIALLITSILFSTESFILLFGLFLFIATYEFCGLIKVNKIIPLFLTTCFYTCFSLANYFKPATEKELSHIFNRTITIDFNPSQVDLVLLCICLFVSIKCIVFLFDDRIQTLDSFSKYIYLIGYILLPFIFITKISFGINDYNPKIIIGLFILIWTNDTFAYLVGKSIGKHKLLERISPKKTWEGTIGGVFVTLIFGFIIGAFINKGEELFWIISAMIIAPCAIYGDLLESLFKRSLNIKDTGTILPGHGGILDRFDAALFAIPFFYCWSMIYLYW